MSIWERLATTVCFSGGARAARNAAEAEFLAIDAGAYAWLLEEAAAGTARMNVKMAEAVALAKISGTAKVEAALGEAALGEAATNARFSTGDLASILDVPFSKSKAHRADATTSVAQGASGWAAIGLTATPVIYLLATDDLEESV